MTEDEAEQILIDYLGGIEIDSMLYWCSVLSIVEDGTIDNIAKLYLDWHISLGGLQYKFGEA